MKPDKNSWHIRPYKKGDEKKIFELMKLVYPEKKLEKNEWMEWWKWKYLNNFYKQNMDFIWVAEDDNSGIIGHVAFIPVKLKIKNQIVTGAQPVDGMIHPKYRLQGIFLLILRKLINALDEKNIFISYATPRRSSYPGLSKVGFFKVTQFKTGLKYLNYERCIELTVKNKILKKIYLIFGSIIINSFGKGKKDITSENIKVSRIECFDDGINDLLEKFSKEHNIMLVKDKKYLNYRYCNYDDTDYIIHVAKQNDEIVGYTVLKCVEYDGILHGIILDIISSKQNKKIFNHLILKTIEYLQEEKVDVISCSMIADKIFINILKSHGFVFSRFLTRAPKKNRVFIIYANHPSIPKEFFKNKKNYFFQLGDFDLL